MRRIGIYAVAPRTALTLRADAVTISYIDNNIARGEWVAAVDGGIMAAAVG